MSRLEMIYLMQVSLYLPTFSDVITFIQVNHSTNSAVTSLKVNPWLTSTLDVEKFYDFFHPDTLNCNFLPVSFGYLSKPIFIRNYKIECTPEIIENITLKICEKMTNFIIGSSSKFGTNDPQKLFQLIVETYRQKVTMSINCFVKFLDYFDHYETCEDFKKIFPKNVSIYFDLKFGTNTFETRTHAAINLPFNRINELPMKYSTQIDINWTNGGSFIGNVVSTQNCRNYSNNIDIENFNYYVPYIQNNALIFQTKNLIQNSDLQKIEKIVEKCEATKTHFVGKVYDLSLLHLPKCVKSLLLKNEYITNSFERLEKQDDCVILPEVFEVEEFVSENVTIQFSNCFDTVKKVEMTNTQIIKKKQTETPENCDKLQVWERELQFPFVNVEELKLVNLNGISYEHLEPLKQVSLYNVRNSEFSINKECAKNIACKGCSNCTLNIDCELCETFEFNSCLNFTFNFLNTKNNKLSAKFANSSYSKISSETDFIKSLSIYNCKDFEIAKNTKIEKLVKLVGVIVQDVVFEALLNYVDIDFTHTRSVLLFNIENFIFPNTFKNCEIVTIEYCNNCQFNFNNSNMKHLKIISSKAINFKGNFNSLEEVEYLDSTYTFPTDFDISKHPICPLKCTESETRELCSSEEYEKLKQICLTKDSRTPSQTSSLVFPQTTVYPNQTNFNIVQQNLEKNGNLNGFVLRSVRRNIFGEVVTEQKNGICVNPSLPQNATTENVKVNSRNFFIKNCICTTLLIEQHIDFLPNIKLENFIGKFPDFSSNAFGRVEMKNCNFVTVFVFGIVNSALNVVELKMRNCTNFDIELMSKTKEVDIVESNGSINFLTREGKYNRIHFERSQIQMINSSGMFHNVGDLCFDATELPMLFEKMCLNNLVMKNIDNVPDQINITSKSATFEKCKNLSLMIGNETEQVVLKMCKRCFVMSKKPENITQIESSDVEIFDGIDALTQRLNQVSNADNPQQNLFGAPFGYSRNTLTGFGFH
ncbi:hypothetical protein EIN_107300 [Entamoeba invadens IP1]|uniref:Uncharacterized protein n=1 Tax=Entamoeba invadens IP1 TaxID=370355 RepID=A0A0A1U754_ENTIV|nr:hypothetical protein EIN_107300 [Entamoeba invadens IP1]ELP90231.1 hypothetical protein EIN_107300 [Entamoeba invadens IP1]|eukprot:XP_004257002.1 hypothetical protein EIN_107300 [Entamoeba invadens IP1]